MKNIGVIGSSQGGAFKAFHKILKQNHRNYNFFVIADRECQLINFAGKNSILNKIIKIDGNKKFSIEAKKQFDQWGGVDFIILFFTRLITEELFESYPVLNLHSSLLPAFQGFSPIKKALDSGVKFFGTTLHQVDITKDGGPILAQAVAPVFKGSTANSLAKVSFIQKVYMLLLFVDFYENKAVSFSDGRLSLSKNRIETENGFNPALTNKDFLRAIVELDKVNKSHAFER